MKVKFLVPEIDRDKWAENFSKKMKIQNLQLNALDNIGVEVKSPQHVEKIIKKKSIPTFDSFLTICRYFNTTPDKFLSAKPKWIECEINDISKFSVLGKFKETFYIAPSEARNNFYRYVFPKKTVCYGFNSLTEEPDPAFFADYHKSNTEGYTLFQRLPYVDSEATSKKIFQLLADYNLPRKVFKILLNLSSNSVTNLLNGRNYWTLNNIYKLSWIFDMHFEDLIVIKYHELKTDIHHQNVYGKLDFDPIEYLEHFENLL